MNETMQKNNRHPNVIKSTFSAENCLYLKDWKFDNGHSVPIFEVNNVNGLNQIIGHIKFNNREYGDVLYRGQCSLHSSMKPSISRNKSNIGNAIYELRNKLFSYTKNKTFCNELKISSYSEKQRKTFGKNESLRDYLVLEAIAQQYGEPTHLLDVVDNHWNALWFGLYTYKKKKKYSYYKKRTERGALPSCLYERLKSSINNGNKKLAQNELLYLENIPALTANYSKLKKAIKHQQGANIIHELEVLENWWKEEADYQYLILLAVDGATSTEGISYGKDILSINLRRIVPSTFLRPHAQHSVMICKNKAVSNDDYDLSSQVVGILKMNIFNVNSWLGSGTLTNIDTIFPPPRIDHCYELLLSKEKNESDIIPINLDYYF